MASTGNIFIHWPTVLLGGVVAAILLVAVFSFQVNQTEVAVVTTLGRVETATPAPGLHFRWPYPFQDVIKFDRRMRCFDGNEGKLEETRTRDGQNIMVGIFVDYRISDPVKFYTELETIAKAESQLNSKMRAAKNGAFGLFSFDQVINGDPGKMKLEEIQALIRKDLVDTMSGFGIEVCGVGINAVNLPEQISGEVIKRMVGERKNEAQVYLSNGEAAAKQIRVAADSQRAIAVANAEAEAREIRAAGDAEAAKYYEIFRQNPPLAIFLRKLDALRQIMKTRTTVVFDTKSAPFDLFQPGAEKLENAPQAK